MPETQGYILLEGGAEFGGEMAGPDRKAITLAGGMDARICIVPTAAAPDHNDRRAGQNGVRWFRQLGATHVAALPLIDRDSANQSSIVTELRAARLIYLLGGFPHYLAQTLADTPSWQAMVQAYRAGAVLGGSSAGAMVLCKHYYDPDTGSIQTGLNLLPHTCIIPHHDTFGKGRASRLAALLPDAVLIGIDEQTGMIDDAPGGQWDVYGRGAVSLYRGGERQIHRPGDIFTL